MRQELINKLHEAAKQCQDECISGDIAVGNSDVPYIFIEGAKWIIENLWHTASEPHDMNRSVIVRLINSHYGFWKGSFTDGKIEKQFNLYSATQVGETQKGIVEKWCYLDDIVPGTY
jgi:hypothetical protein